MMIKEATFTMVLAGTLAAFGCGGGGGEKTTGSAGGTQPAANTSGAANNEPQRTKITAALPDDAFRATLTPASPPADMRAGEQKTVTVHVKNASSVAWPADSPGDGGKFTITLRNRWLAADGEKVINDVDGGTPMVYDLPPGGDVDLQIKITAPKEKGNYILEFDMVQEQVAFFHEKGSTPARVNVKVQ